MPPPKGHGADVMMLIGQLLEATQAASEGLKNTNLEIQANGKALIAAAKTLEIIAETVAELDRLVRTGNGDSIITRIAILRAEVTDLQKQIADLIGPSTWPASLPPPCSPGSAPPRHSASTRG
jgi:hypothetical protein